jgi:hypothetical protein
MGAWSAALDRSSFEPPIPDILTKWLVHLPNHFYVSYTECIYCILQDNFINLAKQGYAAYEQAQQGQGQQNLGDHTQDQQQQHDYQHKEGEQTLPGKHIIAEAFVTDIDEPHFSSQNVFSESWPSSTDREHPIRSIRK